MIKVKHEGSASGPAVGFQGNLGSGHGRELVNCQNKVSMTGLRSQQSMKIVASERTMGFATVLSSSDTGNGVVG
jgi:hypothetical protein